MSASLVGSEMCIRDRARLARVPRRAKLRLLGQVGRERKNSCSKSVDGSAVSYTHLTLPTICSV
eukprot:11588553-Alexandrium_andersonii.AAC.1